MSEALASRIAGAQARLITALDSSDSSAIMASSSELSALIEELRASGAKANDAATRERYEHLMRLANAATYRLRVLRDQTRARLEALASMRGGEGAHAPMTYRGPSARRG